MKKVIVLMLSLYSMSVMSQEVLGFENFILEQDSFLNGNDLSGGFTEGDIFLQNDYNTDWDSWSGWAISNTTDTTTPGFTNQYSVIAGEGNNSSENYATAFVSGSSYIKVDNALQGRYVSGMYINNNTYAYLSMRDGDAFAKKFGGETGDDPDYFFVHILGFFENQFVDSVSFYLADYRFSDNSLDYIIDEWTHVDLSKIGVADSLAFHLGSNDNGQFGMNTPAYLCIDDIEMDFFTSTDNLAQAKKLEVYPNPTAGLISIKHELKSPKLTVIDSYGRTVHTIGVFNDSIVDLSNFDSGIYSIRLQNKEFISEQRVIKL